jgi:hypothetical protein
VGYEFIFGSRSPKSEKTHHAVMKVKHSKGVHISEITKYCEVISSLFKIFTGSVSCNPLGRYEKRD